MSKYLRDSYPRHEGCVCVRGMKQGGNTYTFFPWQGEAGAEWKLYVIYFS